MFSVTNTPKHPTNTQNTKESTNVEGYRRSATTAAPNEAKSPNPVVHETLSCEERTSFFTAKNNTAAIRRMRERSPRMPFWESHPNNSEAPVENRVPQNMFLFKDWVRYFA